MPDPLALLSGAVLGAAAMLIFVSLLDAKNALDVLSRKPQHPDPQPGTLEYELNWINTMEGIGMISSVRASRMRKCARAWFAEKEGF